MWNELVSIIIPVYNVEKYVARCINSLLHQTYRNIEIIVINDGSTDNSLNKCLKFHNEPCVHILSQENKGLSAARNAGLDIAQGSYIAFVDSDDFVAPAYIEKLVGLSIKYDADIVHSGVQAFLDETEIKTHQDKTQQGNVTEIKLSRKEACRELFETNIDGIGCAAVKLYKRSMWKDRRFPIGKLHEDEFMVYKLFWDASTVVATTEKLYYYQSKRADSITHAAFTLKRLDRIEAGRERAVFFRKSGEKELEGKSYAALSTSIIEDLRKMKESGSHKGNEKLYRELSKEAITCFVHFVMFSRHVRLKRKIHILLMFILGIK